ncbi:MAG: phosphoadenosine phosphosulfate reductase, partial [Deltaproteobacteria bacterium]|nr:phosphoadenosine phosphosulfate reductase [Deltaproteobacteria bacterium]
INTANSRVDFIREKPDLEATLLNYKENFWEWIKTVGNVIPKISGSKRIGEIKVGEEVFDFEIEDKEEQKQSIVTIKEVWRDILFLNKIKKVFYKTTYCTHCGACEVECPTGALRVFPKVQIDTALCTHCGHCLNFVEKGCVIAKSIAISPGGGKMGKLSISGFSRYETFGMKEEWIRVFFNKLEEWFLDNSLGPREKIGIVAWFRDAELLERKSKTSTNLCKVLKNLFLKNDLLVWEILWINLSYNSNVIKWYVSSVNWGSKYATTELKTLVQEEYSDTPTRTISNGINSLVKTLETSPFGKKLKLGIVSEKKGKDRYVEKKGTDDIHPIAIAYLLYRYAHDKKSHAFTVSEFYKEEQKQGPYRLFGISKKKFEHILRWLQENKNEMVRVDLTADLDNIHLREDLTYEQILTLVD